MLQKIFVRIDTKPQLETFQKLRSFDQVKIRSTKQSALPVSPEWVGMPEFNQPSNKPYALGTVTLASDEEREEFGKVIGQKLTPKTRSIWFPKKERRLPRRAYTGGVPSNPQYPVYVISKGRWTTLLTVRELEFLGVPYHLVIESPEFEQYRKAFETRGFDVSKILCLPEDFRTEESQRATLPEQFRDDREQWLPKLGGSSIPARNWIWSHSDQQGAKRHWVIDDNIENFHRLNKNMKPRVTTGCIFACMEEFVDRYENIALAGPNYYNFCKTEDRLPPYVLNTRIYSCTLIKNDLPFRWRGTYNEDTDLSLRVLKAGYCTVQFNAFLAGKSTTMRMGGGNTDTIYQKDDRKNLMTDSLIALHPEVKKGRRHGKENHHIVDYRPYKGNKLQKLSNISAVGVDDHGLVFNPGPYAFD